MIKLSSTANRYIRILNVNSITRSERDFFFVIAIFFEKKMSNAFDEMMSKGGESPSSPSAIRRPMHGSWSGYKKVYINGKVAAKCFNCLKTFPNTAQSRLQAHR